MNLLQKKLHSKKYRTLLCNFCCDHLKDPWPMTHERASIFPQVVNSCRFLQRRSASILRTFYRNRAFIHKRPLIYFLVHKSRVFNTSRESLLSSKLFEKLYLWQWTTMSWWSLNESNVCHDSNTFVTKIEAQRDIIISITEPKCWQMLSPPFASDC